MKTRMTLVLFFVLAGRALGQAATNELLAAPKVSDFVVLQTNGPKLEYEVDGFAEESFNPLPAGGTTFVAGKSINLLFHNFNPFIYSVTSTQSQVDDTSFASLKKFLDALEGLGKTVGESSAWNKALADAESRQMNAARSRSATRSSELTQANDWRTLLIGCETTLRASLEASLWLELSQGSPACQAAVLDKLCQTGDLVFNEPPVKLDVKDLVGKARSYEAIFGDMGLRKTLQDEKDLVDESDKQAKASLSQLESLVRIASAGCPSDLGSLGTSTASRFVREGTNALLKRERLSESLGSLLAVLDKYKERNLWDRAGTSYRFASVEPSFDKVQKVAVVVSQRKVDETKQPIEISETKFADTTISIRHQSPFVPEVAAGVAVTDIEVPKYGTAQKDGKTVVATAGSDHVRTIPTLMFNGIFRFRTESFAYPMFQIGVGTGADRPSIVAGIGLRFTHPQHLALSVGYAVTWSKDLDKLKLGDEVKGTADLNADLKLRRSAAKPYISIQYSF